MEAAGVESAQSEDLTEDHVDTEQEITEPHSQPDNPLDSRLDEEELPEYESVVAGSVVVNGDQPDGHSYHSVLDKDLEAARENTLISEAPPTYRQLFGEQKRRNPAPKQSRERRHRPQGTFHRLKQRILSSKLASIFVVSGSLLMIMSLPVSMIIIGGLNVSSCWRHEVPLYLLIGGFILIADIVFQSSISMGLRRNNSHSSVWRTLRYFDCLALFLFIWLVVGTYWILTISLARSSSCGQHPIDDIVIVNTTILVDSEGGTQISVITPQPAPSACPDCGDYVYSFTAFIIMFQYFVLLIGFIIGCSLCFKNYGR